MKQCSRCGSVKETTQFSKRTKSKDGLQAHCKECNVKSNHKFRNEIDPMYMNRWVNTNRNYWNEYCNFYAGSGNVNTIYTYTNPANQIYVGFTRRKNPNFRKVEHKKFYNSTYNTKNRLPLLWNSFDKFGYDNHKFEILHQFEGTKEEGMQLETKLIIFYQSINKSLNVKTK